MSTADGHVMGRYATDIPLRMQQEGDFGIPNSHHQIRKCELCWKAHHSERGKRPKNNDVRDLLYRLKSCNNLQEGRRIHRNAETGKKLNIYVATAIINMYAKCGSMLDAQQVFNRIQEPDVVCWTALILGYAGNGQGHVSLYQYSRMKVICAPNSVTYIAALKACTSLVVGDEAGKRECLQLGRQIHSEVRHHITGFLQNTLIDMYSKCGCVEEARHVFNSIHEPSVVSWNALLLGYAGNGQGHAALDLFFQMKLVCTPNSITYIAALKACISLAEHGDDARKLECLQRGREIHLDIRQHMTQFVQNTLIHMYANCGSMVDAQCVFDSIKKPNVVSWNVLLLGYADNGQGRISLDLFSKMKAICTPNSLTYVAAVKSFTALAADGRIDIWDGRRLHRNAVESGNDSNMYIAAALIGMYAKCGSMVDAQTVFNKMEETDVVSWNALILGYAESGRGDVALDIFSRMKTMRLCPPNSLTYLAALKACTSLADGGESGKSKCLQQGSEIHLEVQHHMTPFVQNTLIDMYSKCGSMADAQGVFDSVQKPNVVSWNALLLGYVDNGQGYIALDLFSRMKSAGICAPDSMTYVAVVKACASIGALAIGRNLHTEIKDFDAHVVTCLVDFYAKCGSMEEAFEVFNSHSRARRVTTWNALLAGYGRFGENNSVFHLFEEMQDQGFQPNDVTFVCILSCCSHAGLVERAREYLKAMPIQYGVTPTMMHYNCMVDVLGRANQLNEAIILLQKIPCSPDLVTWMSLLGACHKWNKVEIGMIFQSLVQEAGGNTYLVDQNT